MKRQELHRDDREHSLKAINRMGDRDTFIPIFLRLRVVGITNQNWATLETRAMLQDRIQRCFGTRCKSSLTHNPSFCKPHTKVGDELVDLDTESEEQQHTRVYIDQDMGYRCYKINPEQSEESIR